MAARKVMSVHSPLVAEYLAEKGPALAGLREKLAISALSRIEKKIYRESDVIQCDSQYTKTFLENAYPAETAKRLEVCPGYAESRPEMLSISRKEARRQLGDAHWLENLPYFFTARRLVPRTGVDALVRAAAGLKKAGAPAFRVMIAGQGPMAEDYRKLASELGVAQEVNFMGSITEERLKIAHRAADCFILPTRDLECFGLVVLEAYASGTPVIATPVGAIPELMGPSPEGLAERNTPEALCERMLAFLRRGAADDTQVQKLVEFAAGYERNKVLDRLEALVMGGEALR
jgi:glycosyltransferase involved in cell wall biosynthesis